MVFRWTGNGRGNGGTYAEAGEHTLVKGLRQGDSDAYAALFSLYRTRIYNYVARFVGNAEDAHDVTQEVFVKAFRQMPANGTELALKPWLYRVATTTCLDHLRARRRRGEPSSVTSEELPALGDTFEQGQTSQLVQETLDRMSERHRLVLLLKDVHGLHHDEIAAIMGVSRGATETLLFRARAAFRRAFLDPDGESSARRSCPETRRAALAFIAGDTPSGERQRVLDHARTCRDCRKVVRRSKGAGFGLALLLPALAVPESLGLASLTAGGAAGTSILGVGAGGGLLAKIGGAAGAKIAIVAAATVTIAGTGVAVEQSRKSARRPGTEAAVQARGSIQPGRRAASPAPLRPGTGATTSSDCAAARKARPEGGGTAEKPRDVPVGAAGDQAVASVPGKVKSNNGNGNGLDQAAANGAGSKLGLTSKDTTDDGQTGSSTTGHDKGRSGHHEGPPPKPNIEPKGKAASRGQAQGEHHK